MKFRNSYFKIDFFVFTIMLLFF